MKAVVLSANWDPKPDFKLGSKDIDKKLTYLGSKVWRNPKMSIQEKDIPKPGPTEVLIKVRACGICGSDVHMAQADDQGYIWYPGLTAFPCTLGHELAGTVEEAGEYAINKRTGRKYEKGEPVCAEEMAWCGRCRPCCDGYPNQCEALQEIGFSIDGAFADYIVLDAKLLWSLNDLKGVYSDEDLFLAGSLVEPTSVAYNALIECGGGIRPGDNAVILGGGPIGLAGVSIMKKAGAGKVILSEPSADRAELGRKMGADYIINPMTEDFGDRVMEITGGLGAKLYLEATGLANKTWPGIEKAIWEGKFIGSTVSIVARADTTIPLFSEVFQVKKANIAGAQGHSGYGTFPRVISCMASGMNVLPLITKKIKLDDVMENIILLQTDRKECKISCLI